MLFHLKGHVFSGRICSKDTVFRQIEPQKLYYFNPSVKGGFIRKGSYRGGQCFSDLNVLNIVNVSVFFLEMF